MHLAFSSMNTLNDPPPPELARALEDRGFESLWYGEHSHIPCAQKTPYPPGGEMPAAYRNMLDPYLSLMAAAAATTTLKLGTGIALLMERDIFSQAKTILAEIRTAGGVRFGAIVPLLLKGDASSLGQKLQGFEKVHPVIFLYEGKGISRFAAGVALVKGVTLMGDHGG